MTLYCDCLTLCILQGLSLLNSMLHTVNTKKWAFPLFETDMQQWLLFLLGLIDYTQKPQECLEELLSTTLPVVKKFKDFIREKVKLVWIKLSRLSMVCEQRCLCNESQPRHDLNYL